MQAQDPSPSPAPPSDPDGPKLPEFLAAVDVGSNSFHMKVARVVGGELRVVDRMREMVQLAKGLDADNRLGQEARERALECLGRFGQRLRDLPPKDVRAVGTNTLRRARNAREFVAEAEGALGHPIEVIGGREEARLIYIGVSHGAGPDREQQRLVLDIGGGSTEAIIGKHFTPRYLESLYMGCVGVSETFFADGRIRRKSFKEAQLAAEQEFEPIQERFRSVGWDQALGASGTIRAVLGVIKEQGWDAEYITAASLERVRELLIGAGDVASLSGLPARRAQVFPGGVAVLAAAFKALGIERMGVSNGALREGVLYDLLGRFGAEDVREMTIGHLWSRFQVEIEQAKRVEATAAYLFGQVSAAWGLADEKYAHALSWAARLHEIGLDIAHSQYHKHGAYLLAHADLAGFSREEQELLAILVRAHRRKFPSGEFSVLPAPVAERARYLAALLRLAVLLHRSRSSDGLPGIVADAGADALRLAFPPGWLDDHPLTQSELAQEAGYLKSAGVKLGFA